ncbi:MAG: NADH-quinone oxidoreductase subunit [Pseudomonadota bacterium]
MDALYAIPQLMFYLLAGLVAISSLMVVTSRNPVTSAIFLVLDLFFVAALYAKLDAHFTAAIQVLVYAGAIVVLFVFVIMLLNLKPDALRGIRFSVGEAVVLLVTLIGFVIIGAELASPVPEGLPAGPLSVAAIEEAGGNTHVLAMRMFTSFLWPFEIASILILLAIVACVMVARKEKPESGKHNLKAGAGR